MIDLPGGASGRIAGNWFVQGQQGKLFGLHHRRARGRQHSSAGLVVRATTRALRRASSRESTFVANWTDDPVQIGANRAGTEIKRVDRR
jgi:hypothetical protein